MTQDTNIASGAVTQRVIEAARRVADDSTDLGEDFHVPSHAMAPLSLALDEYDAALASAPTPQPAAQDAEPDMFWDADDRERFAYDIDEIVSEYDPGQIVSIECAQRLPSFRVLVTAGEDGNSYEYVDAAIAQQKAGE